MNDPKGAPRHILVRFDPHAAPGSSGPKGDVLADMIQAVDPAREAVDVVGDHHALADIRLLFNPEAFPLGRDGLDLIEQEIVLREAGDSATVPTVAIDCLLIHRLAEQYDDDQRAAYLTRLADVLDRGPAVGVHLYTAISFSSVERGSVAFRALPADIRRHFTRMSFTGDQEGYDALVEATFAMCGVEPPTFDAEFSKDFNAAARSRCSDCQSTAIVWYSIADFRTLRSDKPADLARIEEGLQFLGNASQAWLCQDCDAWGIMGEPGSGVGLGQERN